jgi:hypothetical protein
MRRASPELAGATLRRLKREGHIFDYRRDGIKWVIEVPATHHDVYFYPEARGTIVLTTREVFAFTEGVWAAIKHNPISRAGSWS